MSQQFSWTKKWILSVLFLLVVVLPVSAAVRMAVLSVDHKIWIHEANGGVVNITPDFPANILYPEFSPNGQTIAFFSNYSGRWELWLINPDGSNLRQVTNQVTPYHVLSDCSPLWSSDGQWLFFGSSYPGDQEIWKIRVDGTGLQQLTNVPGLNTQSWDLSKDGTRWTYVRGSEGNGYSNQLYLDNFTFTAQTLIPTPQAYIAPSYPKFNVAATKIVYADIAWNSHIINIDGSNDIVISNHSYPVVWHPDGQGVITTDETNLYFAHANGSGADFFMNGCWVSFSTVTTDTTAPVIALAVTPTTIWPPNKKMVDVKILGSAVDNDSGLAAVSIRVEDEYGELNMTVPGFGSTIQLRAWRNGNDFDGRLYKVIVEATDKAGNRSIATANVIVPHNQ